MHAHYLGRTNYDQALRAQDEVFSALLRGGEGIVLGFESEPVITLGARAVADVDVVEAAGFALKRVDRGGQATIHHPGQLVIFPVLPIGEDGARAWVCRLSRATRDCLRALGAACEWDEKRPGIYTSKGKIAAIGVRLRQGLSTHGIAINVNNRLEDFARIRSCGVKGAVVDRLADHRSEPIALEAVFATWMEHFRAGFPQARC